MKTAESSRADELVIPNKVKEEGKKGTSLEEKQTDPVTELFGLLTHMLVGGI